MYKFSHAVAHEPSPSAPAISISPHRHQHHELAINWSTATMEDHDIADVDPEAVDIAAAMGFSGFGMQPEGKKKRKLGVDTFVDPGRGEASNQRRVPEADRETAASGSSHSATDTTQAGQMPEESVAYEGEKPADESNPSQGANVPAVDIHSATHEQLRSGVRLENGDTVVFMP